MAKVAGNIILFGASGMIGDQLVIRKQGRSTILAIPPSKPSGPPSEAQIAHRQKFQQAASCPFLIPNARIPPLIR